MNNILGATSTQEEKFFFHSSRRMTVIVIHGIIPLDLNFNTFLMCFCVSCELDL